jgi:hypothetical protein
MEYKLTYQRYAEGLKAGKLLGLKCNKCGGYTAPPKKVCMECASEDMEIVELSGRGKVQTFTVIYTAPEGFEPPYIVAEVELEEGPWLMGNMIGINPDEADMSLIGKEVKIGSRTTPGDKFTGGELVALTFSF